MRDAAEALARCLLTSSLMHPARCRQSVSPRSDESVRICDDSDLTCARCSGVLVDAVTAQCGHSFCGRCVIPNTTSLSFKDQQCPRCGSFCSGLGDDTNVLEPDILVRSLVERFWSSEIKAASLVPEVERQLDAGNNERALRLCDEGLQHAPEYSPLLAQRSSVFARLGDFRRSLQDADNIVRLRPTWPLGYYRRGVALTGLGLTEDALVAHCVGASLDSDPFVTTGEASELLHRLLSPVVPQTASQTCDRLSHRRCSLRSAVAGSFRKKLAYSATGNIRQLGPLRGLIRRLRQELDKSSSLTPKPLLKLNDPQTIEQSDFDCVLCCRTLLNPAVTPCGHTYCRTCLERCLDYSPSCPLCMRPLSDYLSLGRRPSTKFLEAAMRQLIPHQYFARKMEEETQNEARLPVFVCTTAYPTVPCPLFVSEPRYRLMVRRCIESGSRRFGIASCLDDPRLGSRSKLADFGTLLEVRDYVLLSNGSSILTAIGSKRFRIVERDEKDGYDLARVEFIKDEPVTRKKELRYLHDRVREEAMKWFRQMAKNLRAEIRRSFGEIPDVEEDWMTLSDGPAWAWWILAILPLGPQLQVGVLSATSLEKRLRAIDKTLEYIRSPRRTVETKRVGEAGTNGRDVVVTNAGNDIWQTSSTASCQTATESDLTSMDL
uniref:Putative e3 ubiquitin ligase n=1 Tax=Xenopsylla cheopis TaxID=163159 RepID=A0A6M2DZL5_XENCH